MTTQLTLDRLKPGESCTVLENTLDGDMKIRLAELGWIPGTRVDCLMVSPLGDPVAYRIRGATIALRRSDAARITVTPYPEIGEEPPKPEDEPTVPEEGREEGTHESE